MSDEFFNTDNPTTNGVEQAIKRMDWEEPQKYRVEWSSKERWDFDSAYAVDEFRFGEGARAMMLLLGPDGGEYLIDSNPPGKPVVKKQRTDGYESEDRLAEIQIFSESFNWKNRIIRMMDEATDLGREES